MRAASGWSLLISIVACWTIGATEEEQAEAAPAEAAPAEAAPESKEKAHSKPYTAPSVEGIHWVETFDGNVFTRWKQSEKEKYTGKFTVENRRQEALVGDVGLYVPEEAKHYGAATVFEPIVGKKDVPFVVQFEAKFQDSLSCGGSYLKLYDSEGKEAGEFDSDTRYVIMFGPDRCGNTDKIHFILQHHNPKSGQWEEKHFKSPPSLPRDTLTHLYALIINADNTIEIQIDGEKKASGDLLTSMEPPINAPKEIDDPEDFKPADWVEEAKMNDPESSKPDDWDEDQPPRIPDPDAKMPEGWNEDEEHRIADPSSKQPDDWDDEEDGEWEPPMIDNPVCKVGCGKWSPSTISNPEYKGKWTAPKIDNPAYIGVWKAKQIDNPSYYLDETPYILPKINAVGIDIWTMSKGILFDNILISSDTAKAKSFADESFKVRSELEALQNPKAGKGFVTTVMEMVSDNLMAACVALIAIVLGCVWLCIRLCSSGEAVVPPPPSKTNAKSSAKPKKEKKDNNENDDDSAPEKKENKKDD